MFQEWRHGKAGTAHCDKAEWRSTTPSGLSQLLVYIVYSKVAVLADSAGNIVTSAEGGYVFTSVCLSVCLSVRRITEKVVNGF